jgi:DNA-binding transcriptional regulator LsrR (DeoR family)
MCSIGFSNRSLIIQICIKKMDRIERLKLLSKISRLYYIDDYNQQAIAERLNISRTRVSRYLTRAKKEKVVEIKVNSPWEGFEELEDMVEKISGIKECIIVPSSENIEETCIQIAKSLSGLFDRILKDGDLVGVGWGATLRSVSNHIDPAKKIGIKVIPLLGGLGKTGIEVHTNSVAKNLAERYGGECMVMHSPAVLDSREAKEILEKDSSVSEIFRMFDSIDTAVIGMSDIGLQSTMIKTGNFKESDFNYLKKLGIIGDVNLIFIDSQGRHVKNSLDERIVRAPLEKLKTIRNIIGIAFGNEKIEVIRAALLGRIINILITDEKTAGKILENWETEDLKDNNIKDIKPGKNSLRKGVM